MTKLGNEAARKRCLADAERPRESDHVAGSRSPRVGTPLTLAVALAATATASAGAVAYTVDTTASAKRVFLPADPSFVDHSGLPHVALLETAGSMPAAAFHVLFWNRSLDRALLLPVLPAVSDCSACAV